MFESKIENAESGKRRRPLIIYILARLQIFSNAIYRRLSASSRGPLSLKSHSQ